MWFYLVWQSVQTVAPCKYASCDSVKPLGLKNNLVKLFNRDVMKQSKQEIRQFLEPTQLGMSVAGATLLTPLVSGVQHAFKDYICFWLDLKNVFDEMSCRAVLDVLVNEPILHHLSTP